MRKIHELQLVMKVDGRDRPMAAIWWDGRKVECDNPNVLKELKGISIQSKVITDGMEFFNLIPMHYKSGYVGIKRVK